MVTIHYIAGVCESTGSTGSVTSNRILHDNNNDHNSGTSSSSSSTNHRDGALTETSGGVASQKARDEEEVKCVDSNQHCKVSNVYKDT